MKHMVIGATLLAATSLAGVTQAQALTVGVSIPAADHGWTAGIVYHAQRVAEELMNDMMTSTSSSKPRPIRQARPMPYRICRCRASTRW